MASNSSIALRLLLAPQISKSLALDLAGKQRADARAGEPESQLIGEIRRQHEGVAERMANIGRIDIGAHGSRTDCPVSDSSTRTRPAWIDVSWTPPVPSRDGAGVHCPRLGHLRRLFAATSWVEQAPCRATRPPTGECELVLKAKSNWRRARVSVSSWAIHVSASVSKSPNVRRND